MITAKIQNIEEINRVMQKVRGIVNENMSYSTNQGFVDFVSIASRTMPPPKNGNRTRAIPAKLYKRPVYHILTAVKKQKDRTRKKLLYAKLRQGYKFVVYKRANKTSMFFAKTQREAKQKYGRILYRGLYKWLWGAKLQQLGVDIPVMFQRLLAKSPKLKSKENLVSLRKYNKQDQYGIRFVYNADKASFFLKGAKYKAEKATVRKIKRQLQKRLNEELKKK